jgi:glycosidase
MDKVDSKQFLEEKSNGFENKINFQKELIKLWLVNANPSFQPYVELFDDDKVEKNTAYDDIINEIRNFFEDQPKFGPNNQNLLEMLREPSMKHPYSIREQLEYIRENWGDLLGKYLYRVLIALDLIREEELFRGLGPGESKVYDYGMLEFENYTPDKDWMPNVVMIAKNVYVWLDQLSRKYNKSLTKLNEIPNEELDRLRSWGFNAIWLIGVWERSQASKTIKRWSGNPEAEASAYSIYDYTISHDLGGYESLKNLKDRAWARKIRLGSDMVPNHTGIVSKWTIQHPDWYISLPYPPFPTYTYSGENLSGRGDIGIYLEDKYFSRTDAAVTFKRYDFRNGDTRYIYHGNDGTSFPWNDTAQLNFLNPNVRETVIQNIINASKMFPIIRFDAAMTLTRRHFQRLWFPEPGTGGAIPSRAEHGISREEFFKAMPNEFWREVVDRMSNENPDTLLLAEAFWLLEGFFVRTLGMHRVYNSAFMNMLRDEDNAKYRAVMKNTLEFDPEILKRFVNFMNNPDEETAIKQFGDGAKYFGICTMMVTMPGLPLFGHGQIEGFHEKYGMEYRKSYWNEEINWGMLNYHEKTIFPIMRKRYLFADVVNFTLYDFWVGNYVNEDVFAYSNKVNNERALIIYHNKYAETKGFIRTSVGINIKTGDASSLIQRSLAEGLTLPIEGYCIFKDYITGLEYIRKNRNIHEKGLYIELHAYHAIVFMDFQMINDNEFFHYAQLHDLLGGKGVSSINETLQEMIYQPIIEPFRKLVNIETFKHLIESEYRAPTIQGVSDILNRYLREVQRYSGIKKDVTGIKQEILKILNCALNIKVELANLELTPKITGYLEEILPRNLFEWGIVIAWIFVHLIGRVTSDKNYELRSRSWMDEWRLTNTIELTLQDLSKQEKDEPREAIGLIKILTRQHGLMEKELEPVYILNTLMGDLEIQRFLKVNRYQDVLWFNAEHFLSLCCWLSLISVIKDLMEKDDNVAQKIDRKLTMIMNWITLAKDANYQVDKFLNSI